MHFSILLLVTLNVGVSLVPVVQAHKMWRSFSQRSIGRLTGSFNALRCTPRLLPSVISRGYLDASEFLEAPEHLTANVDAKRLPRPLVYKKRFQIPWDPNATKKSFKEFLYWMYTRRTPKLVTKEQAPHRLPIKPVDLEALSSLDEPKLTWIGHATIFGQIGGINFLTDPVWSQRASVVQYFGPKRYVDPPIGLQQLPKVDLVLISHSHYDHLDYWTIKGLAAAHPNAKYIVPKGLKSWFIGRGIPSDNVHELQWWDTVSLQRCSTTGDIKIETAADKLDTHDDRIVAPATGLKVTFVPAQHWTSRHPFDRNTCLWGGFSLVSPNHRFLFTGDTGYCNIFKTIGEVLGPFDSAAIPIGAYKPRWFLRNIHCNPAEAVKIHQDLRAKQSVAIHWGTFTLADEDFDEPALELARARNAAGLTSNSIFTLGHGETWKVGQAPTVDYATINPESYQAYLGICQQEEQREARLEQQVLQWFGKVKNVQI